MKYEIIEHNEDKPQECAVCGAKWEDGKGFVEEHIFPCFNKEHGSCWTRDRE